ncbi:50S ribosomal protein L30 [archaeon]|nr:50S ribosomal protein L30 [archaeon]
MTKIAIIRITGQHGLNERLKTTLKLLNLHKKNTCVVVPNTKEIQGMIKVIKDLVTWGEITEKTLFSLIEKRGRIRGNKPITKEYIKEKTKLEYAQFIKELEEDKKKIKDVEGLKPFFRLLPPKGGFERKGTKKHFSVGGVLGYRKEKINDLIQKML